MAEKTKSFDSVIDQISSMTVLELSELVKALEEKFGVSAAAMMSAAPAAAATAQAAAPAAEKSEYKVVLKDSGAEKIKVIKALRSVAPNITLTDVKKMVDEPPATIAEAASKEDAKKIKEALEAAGAKVELS